MQSEFRCNKSEGHLLCVMWVLEIIGVIVLGVIIIGVTNYAGGSLVLDDMKVVCTEHLSVNNVCS